MANQRIDQRPEQTSLEDTDNLLFARGTVSQRITWANVVLSFGSNFAPVSHSHAISDVTGLQTALDGKSDTSHNHSISQVTGLQTALDDKADTSHTHIINDTTGLQTALNGKADVDHTHEVADISDFDAAISGKSDVGHGHAISDVSGLQTALDGKASSTHSHAISDVTGLQTALDDLDNGKADVVHTHIIDDVTGLQAALDDKADASDLAGKADASHTHDAADIVSGVLDVDRGGTGLDTSDLSGQAGQVLTVNATEDGYEFSTGGGGSGTVTSVDVALPSTMFGASSGAITSSGTISFSLATGQTADYIFGTDGSGNVGLMALTSNQVPTLAQSKITNLVSDLAGKAAASHTHSQSDVTNLTTDLAGKANASHTHAQSDITNLTTDLAGKADAYHTHAQSDVTGLTSALSGKADSSHTHSQSDVTGLTSALSSKQDADALLTAISGLSGSGGQILRRNVGDTAYEFATISGGGTVDLTTDVTNVLPIDNGGTGLDLSDLSGQAGQVLTVNATEDGLEFSTGGGGSGFETGLSGIEIEDDFLKDTYSTTNGIGFNVVTSGTGATASQNTANDDDRHMGVVALATGTTTTGVVTIQPDHSITAGNGELTLEAIFKSPAQNSTAAQTYNVSMGFSGAYIQGDAYTIASGNIEFYWTGVAVDTGIAFVTNTWYYAKIVISADGSQATVTVKDGTTTYGPTTHTLASSLNGVAVTPYFQMQKGASGTTSRICYLDWIRFRASLTNPRVA